MKHATHSDDLFGCHRYFSLSSNVAENCSNDQGRKQSKFNYNQARNQGRSGGATKIFAHPEKMCWTSFKIIEHSLKNVVPSQKTLRPPWCPKLVTGLTAIPDDSQHPNTFLTRPIGKTPCDLTLCSNQGCGVGGEMYGSDSNHSKFLTSAFPNFPTS